MINTQHRSILSLFLGVLFFASCSGGSSQFTVSIKGLPDDSLICSFVTLDIIKEHGRVPRYVVGGERDEDSVVMFDIDLPGGDQLYKVFLVPASYRADGPKQSMEFFLIPGEKVHIDATYEPKHKVLDYTINGSDVQQQWQDYSKTFEHLQRQVEMASLVIVMIPEQTPQRDSVVQLSLMLRDSIDRMKAEYIGANPTDQLSGYCITTIDNVYIVDSLYQLLGDQVKNGPLKGWLDLQNEMIEDMLVSEKARADEAVEVTAPVDSLAK